MFGSTMDYEIGTFLQEFIRYWLQSDFVFDNLHDSMANRGCNCEYCT